MAKFYPPMIGLGARILKIQKNGTDIASFSANEQNVHGDEPIVANIQVVEPDSTIKTNTTGQFNTITGGLLNSCVVNLEPIQSGSGTPSPQNVRPITGHSSVEVDVYGKNRLQTVNTTRTVQGITYTVLDDGSFIANRDSASSNLSYFAITNSINSLDNMQTTPFKSGMTIYASSGISGRVLRCRYANGNYADLTDNTAITLADDIAVVYVEFTGSQSPSNFHFYPMIRVDGDSTWQPYNPSSKQYTVALGQTVYGGSLDVVSGVLTVDRAYAEFDGSNDENWGSASGTGYHQYGISINEAKNSATAITNRFSLIELSDRGNKTGLVSIENDTIFRFALKDSDLLISDVNAWKTWLSSNPIQVCYELATSRTIQLTPQQIDTLIGMNNIVIPDAGQSLDSVIYRGVFAWDDVEDVVEKLDTKKADISAIGTDESGRTTASKAYAVGEHFYKDGKFCTAIASIASGATLTLNTNYVEGTIADAVRYEESAINMSAGLTYSAGFVLRSGRVADIYIYMTAPDASSASVLLGITPFKPQNNFAFLPVYSGAEPYEIVGSVFIRKNTGEIILAKGSSVTSGSLIYIEGSYICQRQ